jgi:hypothetical protein
VLFDEKQKEEINKLLSLRFRRVQHLAYRILCGTNLTTLAVLYGTDKWWRHRYTQHYEVHFAPLRQKRLNILEIGVGGYADPKSGGASLRMWRTYFPKSQVYGIDIWDKSLHNERRIKTFRGSQIDEDFMFYVVKTIGKIDIVIDDGSHENEHVIRTFRFLFPHLVEDGFYVIEDTQTSYWPFMGGSSEDFYKPTTTMGFLKSLIDGLNYSEFDKSSYEPSYYDKYIVAMYFYHNIVFVKKGLNDEGSNILRRKL